MLDYKSDMNKKEKQNFEEKLTAEFNLHLDETARDLNSRLTGVACRRGSSGYQLVGYNTLNQFYRGDQYDHDEPPGASQRVDNYCATIVDNFSSLLFDAPPPPGSTTGRPPVTTEVISFYQPQLLRASWKPS